jgi:hypothetical protein
MQVRAELFSHLAESHVGIAAGCSTGSERTRCLRAADTNVEQSHEAYEAVEDVKGMLDCLVMEETLAKWMGDDATAKEVEGRYEQVLKDCEARRMERL